MYQLVDVITSGRWSSHRVCFYFNFSSEVLSRTSSHICGRWYLPMFLLRDGLLTFMYSAICSDVQKLFRTTFSSDLRKPCWKTGKSLSPN